MAQCNNGKPWLSKADWNKLYERATAAGAVPVLVDNATGQARFWRIDGPKVGKRMSRLPMTLVRPTREGLVEIAA
jgi:hypothetical protein